ncbi:MAG: ATP-binding protein [Mycetocola sp.]
MTAVRLSSAASFLNRFSRRGQVIVHQAPLAATFLLLGVVVAVVSPEVFTDPRVQSSILLHAAILGLCVVVPWGRLPRDAPLVIPLLDMYAIGLSREVDAIVLGSMSLLLFYPVMWLATAGRLVGPALTLVGSALSLIPTFVDGGSLTVRPFLLPFVLVSIAITSSVVFRSLDRARAELEAKDADLKRLLHEAEHRERLLGTIVETVSVGVLALDDHGHPIIVNQEQRANMASRGEPHRSLAASMPLFGADKTTPIPEGMHPIHRAASGEAFVDQLVWAERGGDRVALAVTGRVMIDDRGDFVGSVLAFSDITTLLKALAARDDFVGNISHEVRTPLTSLLGYLELIRDGQYVLPDDVTTYLDVAERNARRLLRLVTDVLDVAANEMTVDLHRQDLSGILNARVAAAQGAADLNKVSIIIDQPDAITAFIDEKHIARVIDNLLSNAIKFSPAGGTATVRMRRAAHDIVVEFSDTGMGMSADEQSQAFTKFFRSPANAGSAVPGVGLGLLMARTIVEYHGGTLTLASQLGIGTTVTMTLPGGGPAVDPSLGHAAPVGQGRSSHGRTHPR